MKATTIKIENPLLNELNALCPQTKSLSAFVRELLEKNVKRNKLTTAADQYCEFLKSNSEEQAWLSEWMDANLNEPPKKIKRKNKS